MKEKKNKKDLKEGGRSHKGRREHWPTVGGLSEGLISVRFVRESN